MNHTAVDPFIVLEQSELFDESSLLEPSIEPALGPSWQERVWLFLFDLFVGLALLFLLGRALPVSASSLLIQPLAPDEQMTALSVTLTPVDYQESVYGLSYHGSINYAITVENKGLVVARNVTVSISLLNDPLLVQEPWACDFEGCMVHIEELAVGESHEIPLSHSMMVPAIVVENEEDAHIPITPPEVVATASNSLPSHAPMLDATLVCRCLAVYNPDLAARTMSYVYVPLGFGANSVASH